jgi:hypothetical protein
MISRLGIIAGAFQKDTGMSPSVFRECLFGSDGASQYTKDSGTTWSGLLANTSANGFNFTKFWNPTTKLWYLIEFAVTSTIKTSPNISTLTSSTANITFRSDQSFEYLSALNTFIGRCTNGAVHTVHTSSDCVTWTTDTVTPKLKSFVYSNTLGKIFAWGSGASTMYSSSDGRTWASAGTMGISTPGRGVWCSGIGKVLYSEASTGSDNNKVVTTSTGTSWTTSTVTSFTSGSGNVPMFAYSPTLNIVVGVQGTKFVSSTDAATFTQRFTGNTATMDMVVWHNTGAYFLASGATSSFKSTDGINWSAVTAPQAGSLVNLISVD